jgi:hypothetical protein
VKYVKFVVTGPPTADIGAVIGVFDENNERVDVGWWQPADDNRWEYLMPVRLVPELIAPPVERIEREIAEVEAITGQPISRAAGVKPEATISVNERMRQQLRSRIANAPKKEKPMDPQLTEKCPGCQQPFDPTKDEVMDCGNCSNPKSTACCLPDPTQPCLDCQALQPDPEDGVTSQNIAAPPSTRLFDDQFHADPKEIQKQQAAGNDYEEEG